MPEQRTVLITGVSGLLGANLARHYAPTSNCFGWYGSNPVDISGVSTSQIDVTDHDAVSASLDETNLDLIVHCAAATDVEWCEKNPDLAKKINEDATEFLDEHHIAYSSHSRQFLYSLAWKHGWRPPGGA